MKCPDTYIHKVSTQEESPCSSCWRGEDGKTCDCKTCPVWRAWWLARWERIYQYGQKLLQK